MRGVLEFLVFAGVVGQGTFLTMFLIGSRAMLRSSLGFMLLTDALGLFLSLGTIALAYIFHDYPGRALVGTCAFALVILGIYLRVVLYPRWRWGERSHPGRRSTD